MYTNVAIENVDRNKIGMFQSMTMCTHGNSIYTAKFTAVETGRTVIKLYGLNGGVTEEHEVSTKVGQFYKQCFDLSNQPAGV